MMVWRQRKESERRKESLWGMINLGEGTFSVGILMEREDRVIGMRIEVKELRWIIGGESETKLKLHCMQSV